jgi:hypothetical protein
MDFAIFAVAFNIGKLYNKAKSAFKNQKKSLLGAKNTRIFIFVIKLGAVKNINGKLWTYSDKIAA